MKLTQLEKSNQFIGLFAGRSGHGKSVAIASFAEDGPMYVMDLDKRARGMLGVSWSNELLERIEIDQTIDIRNGFDAINKKMDVWLAGQKSNQFNYKTLVFESFGTLVKTLLFESQRLRGQSHQFQGRTRGEVKFIHPDDYNYVSMAINQLFFNCLLILKCNVILSGWIVDRYGQDPKNEYGGSVVIGQKMLGPSNLAEEIVGYFDEVYLFEKEETGLSTAPLKYTVSFEGNLAKTSKSELHGKGKIDITNKSFYKIYKELTK